MGTIRRDLKVTEVSNGIGGFYATLSLSTTGDVRMISGKEKLATQMVRAIVLRGSSGIPLNLPIAQISQVKTLVTMILRNFKARQVREVNAEDPSAVGYYLYKTRIDSGTTLARVNTSPFVSSYEDLSLVNGMDYVYGVSYAYSGGTESGIVEKITIAPSAFVTKQSIYIGTNLVAVPGDKSISFYTRSPRAFQKSELLDSIEDITVTPDSTEPRRWIVDIRTKTLDGELISLATNGSQRFA